MKIFYLIIFIFTVLSTSSLSEEGFAFQGLYEVEVELEGSDRNSIHQGMGKALESLMIKLSGSSEVSADPEIRKAVKSPEGYISEYRLSSKGETILGIFSFSGEIVRKLLSDNSLPLWIGAKSIVLLFLPCKAQDGLLTYDKKSFEHQKELCSQVKKDLERIGNSRNIIFIEPSLDLTDLRYMDLYMPKSINDFLDKIASRYNLLNWTICYIHDEFGVLTNEPSCLSPVSSQAKSSLIQTVEILANELSKDFQLNVDTNLRNEVKLLISGVDKYTDLVLLEEVLQSNTLVLSYSLNSIEGYSVTYNVEIMGQITDLEKLMNTNPFLLNQQSSKDSSELKYFFKGKK